MNKLVFVYADDWEGVYLNNQLLAQDHSINAYALIRALIKEDVTLDNTTIVDSVEAGEWLMYEGYLPETYEEFEEKQNEN